MKNVEQKDFKITEIKQKREPRKTVIFNTELECRVTSK